jgi:hypothetical protein
MHNFKIKTMIVKLIKLENEKGFELYQDNDMIGSTYPYQNHHLLSIKNCEAVVNGYDLEDIKKKLFSGFDGQPDSFTVAAVERTVEIMCEILYCLHMVIKLE